jgi:hypothetical protein
MRTLTISAALLASSIASQAIADSQPNWVPKWVPDNTSLDEMHYRTFDSVIGGYGETKICRTSFYTGIVVPASDLGGGKTAPGGCQYPTSLWFTSTSNTYDVLVPAWQHVEVPSTDSTGHPIPPVAVIPPNATFQGGHGIGKFGIPAIPLYFCRALYFDSGPSGMPINLSMQIGKVGPGLKGCLIPYGGYEYLYTSYDVLVDATPPLPVTTKDVKAKDPFPADLPAGGDALVGGYEADGTALYFCQASYNGSLTPGKTRKEFHGCNISWTGREITVPDTQTDAWKRPVPYQVLVPLWKKGATTSTFPAGSDSYVCRGYPWGYGGELFNGICTTMHDGTAGTATSYEVLSK